MPDTTLALHDAPDPADLLALAWQKFCAAGRDFKDRREAGTISLAACAETHMREIHEFTTCALVNIPPLLEHYKAALNALDAFRAAAAQDASTLQAIAMNVRCDSRGVGPQYEGAFRAGHKQARHDIAEAITGHFSERITSSEAKPTTDAWKARAERAEAMLDQMHGGFVIGNVSIRHWRGGAREIRWTVETDSASLYECESAAAALAWLASPEGIAAVDAAGKAGGK